MMIKLHAALPFSDFDYWKLPELFTVWTRNAPRGINKELGLLYSIPPLAREIQV